jgi:TonB family protein
MSSKIDIKYNGQGCVPQNALVRYLKGELSGVEMNAVERHLAGCPMCADELAGLALLHNPDDISSITDSLNAKVDKALRPHSVFHSLSPYAVAASVAIILGVASIIYFTSTLRPTQQVLSEQMLIEDSVEPVLFPPPPPVPLIIAEEVETIEEEIIPITQQEVAEPPKPPAPQAEKMKSGASAQKSKIQSVPRAAKKREVGTAHRSKARLPEKPLFSDAGLDSDAVLLSVVEDDLDLSDDYIMFDMEEEESFEEEVFAIVEEMPRFKNGDINRFRDYINENLEYPAVAAESAIQGRVILSFVVDTLGDVTNVKVLRGIHPALDSEAVRVVEASPKWEPGKQRGRPVRVGFNIPVVFVLQ